MHTLESLTDFLSEVAKASVSSSGTQWSQGNLSRAWGCWDTPTEMLPVHAPEETSGKPTWDSFNSQRQSQGEMGKLAQTDRDQMGTKTKGRSDHDLDPQDGRGANAFLSAAGLGVMTQGWVVADRGNTLV